MGLCIPKQFFILSVNTSSTVAMVRNGWIQVAWNVLLFIYIQRLKLTSKRNISMFYIRPDTIICIPAQHCCIWLHSSGWPVIAGHKFRVSTLQRKVIMSVCALATLISQVFLCTVHRPFVFRARCSVEILLAFGFHVLHFACGDTFLQRLTLHVLHVLSCCRFMTLLQF